MKRWKKAYARYLAMRKEVYAGGREKPIALMDMGTMGGRYLKRGRPEGAWTNPTR